MKKLILLLMIVGLVSVASACRYMGSGDWMIADRWDCFHVPGSSDTARINWGNNTVTLADTAPDIDRLQTGVDESGNVVINAGGSLTMLSGSKVGNNGTCTGTLVVNAGGTVNSNSWLMVAGNSDVTGIVNVNGGDLNVDGNLLAATGAGSTATIDINNGGVINVGGIFCLGGSCTGIGGGTGYANINCGTLNLSYFTPDSIVCPSIMDIELGVVVIDENVITIIQALIYPPPGSCGITAYDGTGTVHYDYNIINPGKTTIWAEPSCPPGKGNGDVNGDCYVDDTDLLLFANEWLAPTPDPHADFTGDGKVNNADFALLAGNWLN